MAEGDDLTGEQTEQLLHFQDLTGIDDIERCRQILQGHQWNIEAAVQDTFNEREGTPAVFSQPQRSEPRPPSMNLRPADQRVVSVARPSQHGIIGWSYQVIMFPFRFIFSSFYHLIYFFYRLIWPDPRRNVVDPVADVMSFIQMFEERYSTVHPTFYRGSYSQVLIDGKRELRFVLVYLHGNDHQDTDLFARETLCNPLVVEYLNTNVLFWACDTASPEGYRVSQSLRENSYPFLALIVLRGNQMTVVARIEGPISATDLVGKLGNLIRDNQAALEAARLDREERSRTQTLRQQQDEAYRESLRMDQIKEQKRKEAREREEQLMREMREKEEKREQFLQARERRKDELRACIPEEPAKDDPNAINIVLKLPSGTRLERRFLKNQSMKYLYYYVFCHGDCPDDFHIRSHYPIKVYSCEPTDEVPEPPSFEQSGLKSNEVLYIQDNEA